MAQAAIYVLLLISVLPLLQAAQCPTKHYCPAGSDCGEDKNLCELATCSESANGSALCKKGISVSFTQASYSVSEGDGLVQPVIILSEPLSCCNFHVRVNVRDITAKNTLDYKYTSKKSGQMTVVIPAGHTTKSFDLTILEDIIIEDTESFQLSIVDLSLPHDVSVGNIPSATVNIIDNDYACVDFERSTYNIGENDRRGLSVNIILSRPTAIDIPITITNVDIDTSTVECDYEYGPYSVVFKNENKRSGTQRATFKVHIIDDDIYEENERFNLVINTPLHNRISRCSPFRSTVTITNDDQLINIRFDKTSYTVDEDIGSISPVLKLDKPSPCCITVLVELTERTATGRGIDYDYRPPQTPRVYEYTFSAGDTCATPNRPIPIVDDKESDENERFEIHIVDDSIPYGTRISGRDYVTVTIKDNDINVCFDQEDYMVNENENTLTIDMSLDESPPEDFVFTISDDPIGDASEFYSGGPYNVTIKRYQRKVNLVIPINAMDRSRRCTGNRTFYLTIDCPSPPRGIQPCPYRNTTRCVIVDNESGGVGFVRDRYEIRKNQVFPTKPELFYYGSPLFNFSVQIHDEEIDSTSDIGRATAGIDYLMRPPFIEQFYPKDRREKRRSLTVYPIDDNIVEDNETYHMLINEQLLRDEYPCICAHNTITNITIVNDDYVIVKIDQKQGGSEDLIFTRSLKFDTDVTVFYDGDNETETVRGDPNQGQAAPTVPLKRGYEKIILSVHPAVYDYVTIQVPGIISKIKKRLV